MTALATIDTTVSIPNRHAAADARYKEWLKRQLKEPQRTTTHTVALHPANGPAELVALSLHTGRRRPSVLRLNMFTDAELDLRHLDGNVVEVEWGADEFDGKAFCETEYTLTEMIEAGREGFASRAGNPVAAKKAEAAAIAAPVDDDDEQDYGHAAKDELELPKYDPERHAKHFEDTPNDEDDLAGAA